MAAEYPIRYTSDVDQAAAGIEKLIGLLGTLDALADRVRPKLAGLTKGMTGPVGTAAKAVDRLNASLAKADAEAVAASGAVGKLGTAAAGAAPGLTAAGAATTSLGTRLNSAGRNANTAAGGLGAAATAAGNLGPRFVDAGEAAQGFGANTRGASSALNAFTGRMIALQAAHAIFRTIVEESEKLEERWQKLAKEATDFRDSLRELGSLKGKPGPTNEVAADVLDLAVATRMATDDARAMDQAYENLGPTVREKGHFKPTVGTPEQLEKDILAETGKTAQRLGIGKEEAGTGIGTAGLFHTFTTTGDAIEQFGGAMKGLQEGAVKYGAGLKALNVAAAKLVDTEEAAAEGAAPGTIGSFAEAGVTLGVLSLGTGGAAHKAGTRMVQISRALNPAADKAQGVPARVLQDIGVAGKAVPDQLIQLSKFLKAQKIADPKKWLETNKIGTEATREAVVAGLKSADVLETRIRRTRESAKTGATGKATIAENKAFMATDLASQAAGIEAATQATDVTLGVKVSEQLEQAKKAADLRQKQKDPGYNKLSFKVMNALNAIPSLLYSGVGGAGAYQEFNAVPGAEGAIPFLKKEAARVGADISRFDKDLAQGTSYEARGRAFEQAAEAVRAKGGDPYGVSGVVAEAQKRIEGIRPAVVPAPAAGAGAGAPPAPAGAGIEVEAQERVQGVLPAPPAPPAFPAPPALPAARPFPAPPAVVPAARPGAPLAPAAAGGVGPQASAFGAGGPGAGTGAGAGLSQKTQDDQLKRLDRLVAIAERPRGPNGAGAATLGPLPFDDGDFGGRRS